MLDVELFWIKSLWQIYKRKRPAKRNNHQVELTVQWGHAPVHGRAWSHSSSQGQDDCLARLSQTHQSSGLVVCCSRKHAYFTRWPQINTQMHVKVRKEHTLTQSSERKWGKAFPPSLSHRWGVALEGWQHELPVLLSRTCRILPSWTRDQTHRHGMDAMRNHLVLTCYGKIMWARCVGPVRQASLLIGQPGLMSVHKHAQMTRDLYFLPMIQFQSESCASQQHQWTR